MLPDAPTVEDAQVLAYALAYIPVLAWLAFFYTRDRFEPEPKRKIAGLFVLGVLCSFVAGVGNAIVTPILAAFGIPPVIALVLLAAPLVEEVVKVGTFALPTRRSPELNEPVDGMIYGTTVGLGFAAAEHVDYFLAAQFGVTPFGTSLGCTSSGACLGGVAFDRLMMTTLMHATATGVAGYYFSQYVLGDRASKGGRLAAGLAAAVALHALFNFGAVLGTALLVVIPLLIYIHLFRKALAASPFRHVQVGPRTDTLEQAMSAATQQLAASARAASARLAEASGSASTTTAPPEDSTQTAKTATEAAAVAAPPDSAMLTLVQNGLITGPHVTVTDGAVVGAGAQADVNVDGLPDAFSVAPRHASFHRDASGGWTIRDLDSGRGTVVREDGSFVTVGPEGRPVTQGELIGLGHIRFRFWVPEAAL